MGYNNKKNNREGLATSRFWRQILDRVPKILYVIFSTIFLYFFIVRQTQHCRVGKYRPRVAEIAKYAHPSQGRLLKKQYYYRS